MAVRSSRKQATGPVIVRASPQRTVTDQHQTHVVLHRASAAAAATRPDGGDTPVNSSSGGNGVASEVSATETQPPAQRCRPRRRNEQPGCRLDE